MAITSNTYTGNGSNKLFSITFPYIDTTDVDVYLNGVLQTVTTQYTFANATTIEFVVAPGNGVTVVLQRSTQKENLNATFFPGSSIKAADLNENFDQLLYISQENTDVVNNLPVTVTMLRWKKTATAGQTVLTGNDDNAISLVYTAGFEQVYLNGAHLTRNADYTASDGATITMSVALLVNDLVEVMAYAPTTTASINSTAVPFTQTGTGAVTRNVDSKLKDVVSVKDFGAVGDGTTNDTVAIQAAIDAVSANPIGGVLQFQDGTYMVNTLLVGSNITLDGNGSTLKARPSQNHILRLTGSDNIAIENFIFDCTNLTDVNTEPLDAGLKANAIYRRVGTGVLNNLCVVNNRFINIPTSSQDYHAIGFNEVNGFVENNTVDQCGGDALNFNGGFITVISNTVKNTGDGGIALNNGARGVVSDNYLFKCDLGVGCGPVGSTGDTFKEGTLQLTGNCFDSCNYGVNLGWYSFSGRTGPTNFVVDSNVFIKCKTNGFRYNGHATSWKANGTISNNVFYLTGSNAYNGTASVNSDDLHIANCGDITVIGNTLSSPSATGVRNGIYIDSSSRTVTSANIISGVSTGYTAGIKYAGTSINDAVCSDNAITNAGSGIHLAGTTTANQVSVTNNSISDFITVGILVDNTTFNASINSNSLRTTSATSTGINLSPAIFTTSCNFNYIQVPVGRTAIVENGPVSSDNYDISYNTVFGRSVIDGGPAGSTKRVTGNW